jgi:hypothetical protein
MWETRTATPLGKISMRNLLSCVAAVFVTVFLYNLVAAPRAFAADASWNGESLVYESNQYQPLGEAKAGDSHHLPVGSNLYGYVSTSQNGTNIAHVIYFDPGVNPKTAANAKLVTYDFTPPDNYSNPSPPKDISLDASSANKAPESCVIKGVGWIVCSLSDFLASGMDTVFGILVGFITVQPTQINQTNDLYKAWNFMRSFANIAFVIAFLIIIYSQLTSIGLSNYSLKKLLPRLIVAAVLVNISYYICAAGIDLSNILGYAIQGLFMGIRGDLFHIYGNTWTANMTSWSSVTGFVLSGGTALFATGVGAAVALTATGGVVAAAIYLLLPALLGLLIAVLVVMLILAARQAIIVILVILAPLAFVAYLLPNTEKLFEKWRQLFITMLVFFPAFSLVFGGAQVAGAVIIQNATSINMVILGMAVQVAPLVIAPLLLKLSGSLLGRIAGIVNNPGKGLIDRTRNWANERAEMHKQRGLGDGEKLGRAHFLRNGARALDNRSRRLKERTANYSAMSDNRYNASAMHAEQDLIHRQVGERKEIIEKELELKWNGHVKVDAHALEQDLKLRVLSDEVAVSKGQLDKRYEDFKAGFYPMHVDGYAGPQTQTMAELLNRAEDTTQALAIQAMSTQAAKNIQSRKLTEALISSTSLQTHAGGVAGKEGADIALAQAINTQRSDFGKNVEAARSIMKHFNFSTDEKQEHALGNQFHKDDAHGNRRVFTANDIYTREAAIEDQLKAAPFFMGDQIIKKAVDPDFKSFRETIASTMESAGWSSKAAYYDGEASNAVRQGTSDVNYFKQHAAELVAQGKISPKVLAENHKNASSFVKSAIQDLRSGTITINMAENLNAQFSNFDEAVRAVKDNAKKAYTDPRLNVGLGDDREAVLKDIHNNL